MISRKRRFDTELETIVCHRTARFVAIGTGGALPFTVRENLPPSDSRVGDGPQTANLPPRFATPTRSDTEGTNDGRKPHPPGARPRERNPPSPEQVRHH